MKRKFAIAILGVVACAASSYGDGYVYFSSYAGNNYNGAFTSYLSNTVQGVDSTFRADLYYSFGTVSDPVNEASVASITAAPAGLTDLGVAGVNFDSGFAAGLPGYFDDETPVRIPGYTSGPITFEVVAFDGTNYANSVIRGRSGSFTMTSIATSSQTPPALGDNGQMMPNFYVITNLGATNIMPVITSQPNSQTNYVGTTVSFGVTATGSPPLSYRWRKNGTNLTDNGHISGSQSNTLVISNIQLSDAGNYQVVVTNVAGSAISAVATLTVQISPDLAPIYFSAPATVMSSQPNPPITVMWGVTNQGGGEACCYWYDTIWFSTNGVLDDNSIDIGDFEINEDLVPGGSYYETNTVSLPLAASGNYTLFVQVNAYEDIYETDMTNNVSVGVPGTFTLGPTPDLAPISLVAASNNVAFYPPDPESPMLPVVSVVTNEGPGTATNIWGFWYDTIYVSTNTSISGAVSYQDIQVQYSTPLSAGASYTQTNAIALPQQSGTYYLIYEANSYFLNGNGYYDLYETDTNNNLLVSGPLTLTYQVNPPDLAPVSMAPASNNIIFYPTSPQSPTMPLVSVVTNQGTGVASNVWGFWVDVVYVSTNTSISGAVSSQSLGENGPVAAGGSYTQTNTITLPQQSGTYYLIYEANWYFVNGYGDGYYDVYEANTNNNVLVSEPLNLTYQVNPPDLAPVSLVPASNSIVLYPTSPQSPTVPVVSVVTNQGTGVADDAWDLWGDTVYVSTNTSISGAVVSQTFYEYGPLAAGGSYTQTNTIALPQQSGTYYLIYLANSYFVNGYGYYDVYEADTNNNTLVSEPITVSYQVRPPDLALVSFVAGTNNIVYYPSSPQTPTVQVSWAVTNQGTGEADGVWYDAVYVSTNPSTAGAVGFFDYYLTGPVSVGGQYMETNTITLPQQSGTYYLIFSANYLRNVYESNYVNNVSAAVPITVTYQVRPPDLAPTQFSAATNNVVFYPTSPQSPSVQVVWAVTNQGTGPASNFWYDAIYVSTNATIAGEVSAFSYGTPEALPVGGHYGETNTIPLPQQNGTYYLILSVNDGKYLFESNYLNNEAVVPITVTYQVRPPDLAPASFVLATNATVYYLGSGQAPTVQAAWAVMNQGTGPASGFWWDNVYISTNNTVAGRVNWYTYDNSGPVEPGSEYAETNTITLPEQAGTYYLILSIDDGETLYESTYTNNISTALAVTVTDVKSTPVLTWANPTPITYGTPLGIGQLDATANLPGTHAYTPSAGAVLNAGTNTLSDVFTPTDAVDYNNVTGSVSLVVLPAPLSVTASNVSRAYGQTNPPLAAGIAGLQNGDNITATATCAATTNSPPGNYPIIPVLSDPGGRLRNYVVTTNIGTLTVTCPTVTLSPGTLPMAFANAQYNQTVSASGGFSPYTFSVTGGSLPSGLNISTGGAISGSPANASTNSFTVTATDIYGCTGSQVFTLISVSPPVVTIPPQSETIPVGSNAVFSVTASGTAPFYYQWQFDSANLTDNGRISGSQSNELTVPVAQGPDSGDYQVVITNAYGAATSAVAVLTVELPPSISTPPQSQSVGVGGTANFTVGVSGTAPFSYQWLSNGIPLAGATGSTLTLGNVQPNDAAQYRVVVANLAGSVTSAPAGLSVLAGYCANAQTSQAIYAMGSVVPITVKTLSNCVAQAPAPNESATIWISNGGFVRTLPAVTGASGSVVVDFVPLPTEAGVYQIAAGLPGEPMPAAQASFTLVGMSLSTNNITAQLIPGDAVTNTITLSNLTSVDLTGLSAAAIGVPGNMSVQFIPPPPGTLSGGATGLLTCVLTATGNGAAQDQFSIQLTTEQGTTNIISVAATVVAAIPKLAATPGSLNAAMLQGGQTLVSFNVANVGGADSGPVEVILPQAPWLTLVTPQPIPSLAPGQSSQVTLELTPTNGQPLGPYTGGLELSSQYAQSAVPFVFDCVSSQVGALQVTVQDELTYFESNSPNVSNATVTVSEFFTGTNVVSATTSASGVVLFTNLNEDYYNVSVSAPDHGSFSATVLVSGGQTNEVTAFVSMDLVDYTWIVTPTSVPDHYDFTLDATFQTQVPVPVITVDPGAIDLCMLTNQTNLVNLTINNSGLIKAEGLNLNFGTNANWLIQPLVTDLGDLLPETNIVVPVNIIRLGSSTDVAYQIPAWLNYHVTAVNGTFTENVPIYLYDANPLDCLSNTPTPPPQPITCTNCDFGGGGGGGGGGGLIPPPPVIVLTPQAALVDVKIEIDQSAVIAREGFHATLKLANNSGTTISDLSVVVKVYDGSNNVANSLFGIPAPALSGLNAVDGTGTMANGASGQATWTIVPATNAAPQTPTQYSIGGTLSYTLNGEPVVIQLFPTPVTVLPTPIFSVDYFLEHDVYSDDPFTPQIEPSIPFGLGILVKNNGYGTAQDFSITSSQPKIVENTNDLLIAFAIISSQVGSNAVSPSLTLDFGDLGPQSTAEGLWNMTCTLEGDFIAFDASYKHTDDLGNTNTSLISSVRAHEMNHVVRLTVPSDDGLADFLVNDTTNVDALPEVVYSSDGTTDVVTSLSISNTMTTGVPTASVTNITLTITSAVPAGWVYLEAVDPSGGNYPIVSVRRSDGTHLLVGPNVWQTPARPRMYPAKPYNLIHIFDYNPTATYTVTYGQPITAPSASTEAATEITQSNAVLNATVTPEGADTDVYFQWGMTTNYGNATAGSTLTLSLYSPQAVAQGLEGLQANTVYHYRVVAVNSVGTEYGNDAIFETLTNLPPVIAQVTNETVVDGTLVNFTNQVQTMAPPITWRLGGGAPAGASIDTNGVFTWTPTCQEGSSTNQITILATDSSSPPLTGSMTFVVTVGDCLQIGLGSTVMQVGTTSSVPVNLITSVALSNLSFTVIYPAGRFTNWSAAVNSGAINATNVVTLNSAQTFFSFGASSNQPMQGPTNFGSLSFTAMPGNSAFVPLGISAIIGAKLDGNNVGNPSGQPGRVVVIGAQPLLAAGLGSNSTRILTLYGNPGTNYQFLFSTNLLSNWQTGATVLQTNLFEQFYVDPSAPLIFYRAH